MRPGNTLTTGRASQTTDAQPTTERVSSLRRIFGSRHHTTSSQTISAGGRSGRLGQWLHRRTKSGASDTSTYGPNPTGEECPQVEESPKKNSAELPDESSRTPEPPTAGPKSDGAGEGPETREPSATYTGPDWSRLFPQARTHEHSPEDIEPDFILPPPLTEEQSADWNNFKKRYKRENSRELRHREADRRIHQRQLEQNWSRGARGSHR